MKKFFKTKEAGTITPLPPTSPAASTSSFGTPRPFEEYQARVASQGEHQRPLSYQAPSASSRSARGSSDENGYAYPSSQHRRSQQYGASDPIHHSSPAKNPFSNQVHAAPAAHAAPESAYESYSDPITAQTQSYRPPYDRTNTSDFERRASQPTPSHASSGKSYQQPPSMMAAISPPRSLRPAQAVPQHRPHNSLTVGPASGAGFHHQNGLHPPPNHVSMDSAWVQRRRSDDYDDGEDDQTPTAAAAAAPGGQRSAAYPVYSGAEGDEDDGEVLISQGRYEETVLKDPPSKDKKGKKLFGFATGGNKDKRAKEECERTPASSPIPRGSRERVHDQVGPMSPPLDHTHERNKDKEGGWIDRWNKRAHQHQEARLADKEAEELVSSRIGWIASSANTEQDWMQILSLIDIIAQSDAGSKEAARALRKEFKYGSVDTQRRAVRIWALLTLNGSNRFRQQIASKKFLEAVEDTIASSKTPLSVKETMLRVLGVLAFEFRDDADLAGVTKCWNKVKPNDRRKDGEPLEDDLFEFRLPQPRHAEMQQQHRRSRSQRQPPQQDQQQLRMQGSAPSSTEALRGAYLGDDTASQRRSSATSMPPPPTQQQQQQQPWSHPNPHHQNATANHWPHTAPAMEPRTSSGPDIVSNLEAAAASMEARSASHQSSDTTNFSHRAPHEIVAHDEDVRRLHEECQIARSNASVLLDTLLHEGLHADTAEVVDEFYNKVVRSQDVIASQIPWASAQADRSREWASSGERETKEEKLLADLLDAHGRTSEAMRVVDEARRRIEEEEEERRVTERSKVEVRLDRSALMQDSSGELYEMGRGRGAGLLDVNEGKQEGGSRSASPSKPYSVTGAGGQGAPSLPSSGFSSNVPSTNGSARISRPLPVPRSDQSSSDSTSIRSAQFPPPQPPTLPPHPTKAPGSINSTASNSLSGSTHSRSSQFALSPPNPHPSSAMSTSPAGGRSLPLTPNLNIRTDATKASKNGAEEEEDDLQTPIVPSEKALGKRRAVSVRYPTPPLRPTGTDASQQPPALPPHPNRNSGGNGIVDGLGGMRIGH